jgi:FMN phosphatase YigB (HAD superfamily)
MKLRAIIFDVYQTILNVDPAPADAEGRWSQLLQAHQLPSLSLGEVATRTRAVTVREHARANQAGISFPEIFWPDVVREAFPPLQQLPPAELDRFLFEHAQLVRTVRLMPGAASLLQKLAGTDSLLLGIASNAQPYTFHELESALAEAQLTRAIFDPAVQFWSFESGFSKPDPHVFRWLSARLRLRDIRPFETLMVGDRMDNDILPARAQGWHAWRLTAIPNNAWEGDWNALQSRLLS